MNAQHEPDFWELKQIPGYFSGRNDAATWLQNHKNDPYWMAHQLNNINSPHDYSHFLEYWELARHIRGPRLTFLLSPLSQGV